MGNRNFGEICQRVFRLLAESGQTYWQLLPIDLLAMATLHTNLFLLCREPYLIDLDDLAKVGLLLPEEYQGIQWSTNPARVDYGLLYQKRFQVLKSSGSALANNKQAVQCFAIKKVIGWKITPFHVFKKLF
ncbi:MAG: 4-alpha-glucanotransferase [Faecalibacterium sp.]